jgi:hypothetical protein
MHASLRTLVRVAREVAYGVDSLHALMHGTRPAVPPYPPPSVFSSMPAARRTSMSCRCLAGTGTGADAGR